MLVPFIISFREILEALLIIAIIKGRVDLVKVVMIEASVALLSSIVFALITSFLAMSINNTLFVIAGSILSLSIIVHYARRFGLKKFLYFTSNVSLMSRSIYNG